MSQSGITHIAHNWSWKGDFNPEVCSENTPAGPTALSCFHGTFATLAVHYSF